MAFAMCVVAVAAAAATCTTFLGLICLIWIQVAVSLLEPTDTCSSGYNGYISPPVSSGTPEVFYTCFYKHAHRLRLEKTFLPLLDPGGGFRSQKRNGGQATVSEVERSQIYNGFM